MYFVVRDENHYNINDIIVIVWMKVETPVKIGGTFDLTVSS